MCFRYQFVLAKFGFFSFSSDGEAAPVDLINRSLGSSDQTHWFHLVDKMDLKGAFTSQD